MPFLEHGAEPLLRADLAAGTLDFSTSIEAVFPGVTEHLDRYLKVRGPRAASGRLALSE